MNIDSIRGKSVGLVLSGGGVRGMAHIGVIKAMREYEIEADYVSGSSAGALVGALYAQGHTVEDMLKFFRETPLFKYNFFALGKPGLVDTERYFDIFKEYFPEDNFGALEKRLSIAVTNLELGSEEIIEDGELIKPLLASAALPPIFSPVSYRDSLYADGGIMNNFPSEAIRDKVDTLLGSNVSVVGKMQKKDLTNSVQIAARTTALMIYAMNKSKINSCELCITPKALEHIGVLDRKGIEEAYAIGYEEAIKQFEKSEN